MIDGINFEKIIDLKESSSSDFKPENKNSDNEPTIVINKVIENKLKCKEEISETWIKNKHTQIIKSKKMTPIIRKLHKIHANL